MNDKVDKRSVDPPCNDCGAIDHDFVMIDERPYCTWCNPHRCTFNKTEEEYSSQCIRIGTLTRKYGYRCEKHFNIKG
jgi:hypothetical protein